MAERTTGRPISLLQITDTHLHADVNGQMRGVMTYETLVAVLAQIQNDTLWPPDAIVVTGDIVQDGTHAGYERFRDALAPFALPVYCLPGNHDDPDLMTTILAEHPFQVGGSVAVDDWYILFLSSYVSGTAAGEIGPSGLAAMRDNLIAHPDRHTLICLHHQPLPMGSTWLDSVGLRDAGNFLSCIADQPQVRGIVWGHVHQASDRLENGVRFLSSPSTCAQFLPDSDSFALDVRPPGWRWLQLYPDGSIETTVGWLPGKTEE